MKKILLATTLLSIAMSENILMENHPRLKTPWICDKQSWNRKTKRIPRKDIPSKIDESLNYDDDRQFPRISDTRFISESRKLPSIALIRQHDLAQFSQVDLFSDKSKFNVAKPKVSISIGIQGEKSVGNDLSEDCSTRKAYCKNSHSWQLQQPFYVDEPRWIDIDVDYIDSAQRVNNDDPYILTRGKKIYRINDPEQARKTIEDYETSLDYPGQNKNLLIKSRVRRSARMNVGTWNRTADKKNNRIEERNRYDALQDIDRDTNDTAIVEIEDRSKTSFRTDKMSEDEETKDTNYDVFNGRYEENALKNLAKRSPRGFKFTKQNRISVSGDSIITDFVEQKQKIQREGIPNDIEDGSDKTAKIGQTERFSNSKDHFAINTNKRNKKSELLKNQEIRNKRETYDANSKKDEAEKNEIEMYERMKNKVYVDKPNDLGTPDKLFILSRDKDLIDSGTESLNKKDTNRNEFIEKTWELHYAHRKKLESEGNAKNEEDGSEINNGDIRITDSQLTNESNSKNFETKTSNYREKRNVCKVCKVETQFKQDEWLKDIEKKIQLSLERRDKHSDILERLSLNEPYFISRGKKTPQDLEMNDLSSMSNSRSVNDDRARMIGFPVPDNGLRTLLMEMARCNNDNCDINADQLPYERLTPRDRRGTLDEILAAYDPYYVARGKRMNRNQMDALFETDTRQ